jgi:predicted transcriptional regulator
MLEHLSDLYFELSNEDRLRILESLQVSPNTVTGLSRELGLTNQECSRHLSRLALAKLTRRSPRGDHSITPFGSLSLELQGSQSFVAEHLDYFNTHSLGGIPSSLLMRFNELSGVELIDDIMVVFHNVEGMLKEADDHIYSITNQYIASTIPLAREAFKRGVTNRAIDLKGYQPPPELREAVTPEDTETWYTAQVEGRLEMRVLDDMDVFLWMSEKEVAVVSFPTLEGRFDYKGFTSKDERAIRWCEELFLHHWDRGEPKREFSFF